MVYTQKQRGCISTICLENFLVSIFCPGQDLNLDLWVHKPSGYQLSQPFVQIVAGKSPKFEKLTSILLADASKTIDEGKHCCT